MSELVRKAAEIVGGQAALARRVGCSQQLVSKMCAGHRSVSAETAAAIDTATDGKVRKWELRPDLFDAPKADAA